MLVYGTELFFGPDSYPKLAKAAKLWIREKTFGLFDPYMGKPSPIDVRLPGARTVKVIGTQEEYWPRVLSISLTHPDEKVGGRAWELEFGMEQESAMSSVRATISLKTSDISPKTQSSLVYATRPRIVDFLLEAAPAIQPTCGLVRHSFGPDDDQRWMEMVLNPNRKHFLLLVSLDPISDQPKFNLDKIANKLAGLCEIGVLRSKLVPQSWFRRGMENHYFTRDGGVLIVPPGSRRTEYWTGREIDEAKKEEYNLEQDLFTRVIHLTNLPMRNRHISPSAAQARLAEFKMKELTGKLQAAGDDKEILKLYETENQQLQGQIRSLQDEVRSLHDGTLNREIVREEELEEMEALKRKVTALQEQLRRKQRAEKGEAEFSIPTPEALTGIPSIVEAHMSDRLVISNAAVKSLRDSPYEDIERAWGCFQVLNDGFFRHLSGESPLDPVLEDLRILGIEYSPKMSASTVGMYPDLYTRTYLGQPVELNRHLKLGTSRAPERCFRLYFEWMREDKDSPHRIHILHAGRHLDTTQT